ncbi:MAG: 4-phosphoerythronate dehydrogenase, partial [Bacteroidales bacterium]|nr:4-phosphoerythronate dehydrogenase [Bacteroidales bacterium]
MKIVADENIPFLKGVLEPYANVVYLPGKEISPGIVKSADALIIRTRTICNKELLKGSSVKFIASATIGFDHIDTKYCKNQGITWTNAPGCNSSSVQQYIAAALVHEFRKHKLSAADLTMGIIGVGNVGSKVANLGNILGMRVLLNDPPRERSEGSAIFTELYDLIHQADIVTLHVPLSVSHPDKTFHMVNNRFLSCLKHDCLLINTSRGSVVDEQALKQTLKQGRLKGVILDVWENEPDIDRDLLQMVDIGTPHIAGYSQDGKANGTSMSVKALAQYFNLPLKNWYPGKIPSPEQPDIYLDGKNKIPETLFYDLFYHTYPVKQDDLALRKNPDKFEYLRGSYPVRREFQAYNLVMENVPSTTIEKIEQFE